MILAKLKTWALALFAVLAAIGSAWLWGRHQGKATQVQSDAVRDAQANAQAVQQQVQAQETRRATETEISKLPDAPAQKLADAAPGTAAGHLRDDGWLRTPDDHQD